MIARTLMPHMSSLLTLKKSIKKLMRSLIIWWEIIKSPQHCLSRTSPCMWQCLYPILMPCTSQEGLWAARPWQQLQPLWVTVGCCPLRRPLCTGMWALVEAPRGPLVQAAQVACWIPQTFQCQVVRAPAQRGTVLLTPGALQASSARPVAMASVKSCPPSLHHPLEGTWEWEAASQT